MPGLSYERLQKNRAGITLRLSYFFSSMRVARARIVRLHAMRQPREQPWQHDLELDVVFGHIDRSAHLLFQCGHLECEAVAAPDFLVHLKNLSILRANAAEPNLQPPGCFFPAELVRNGNDEGLGQCRASEQCERRNSGASEDRL